MYTLLSRPALSELYGFIARVERYPISVDELLGLASKSKSPRSIFDFYKSFGRQQVFDDQEDLIGRSEQVELMRREEAAMPPDGLTVPCED